jgi:hypothetical protein
MDTAAWIDQHDTMIAQTIRRHGWFIQYVLGGCTSPDCTGEDEDDLPPFAYTVGMVGLAHPELVVVGVGMDTSRHLLNDLGERVRNDEALLPGRMLTFAGWSHRVIPELLPNPGEIVLEANRFYRRPPEHSVPALQLGYDDRDGRFPWEEGHLRPDLQPRPGTWRA